MVWFLLSWQPMIKRPTISTTTKDGRRIWILIVTSYKCFSDLCLLARISLYLHAQSFHYGDMWDSTIFFFRSGRLPVALNFWLYVETLNRHLPHFLRSSTLLCSQVYTHRARICPIHSHCPERKKNERSIHFWLKKIRPHKREKFCVFSYSRYTHPWDVLCVPECVCVCAVDSQWIKYESSWIDARMHE